MMKGVLETGGGKPKRKKKKQRCWWFVGYSQHLCIYFFSCRVVGVHLHVSVPICIMHFNCVHPARLFFFSLPFNAYFIYLAYDSLCIVPFIASNVFFSFAWCTLPFCFEIQFVGMLYPPFFCVCIYFKRNSVLGMRWNGCHLFLCVGMGLQCKMMANTEDRSIFNNVYLEFIHAIPRTGQETCLWLLAVLPSVSRRCTKTPYPAFWSEHSRCCFRLSLLNCRSAWPNTGIRFQIVAVFLHPTTPSLST